MKKILYLLLSCVGLDLWTAGNDSIYPQNIASTLNIELRNSSKGEIGVMVTGPLRGKEYYVVDADKKTMLSNPSKLGGNIVVIPVGGTFASQVNLNEALPLTLWRIESGNPTDSRKYTITGLGKTRYLSYDASKKGIEALYPQSGKWMGVAKFIGDNVTATGLSMKNNVDNKDISFTVN